MSCSELGDPEFFTPEGVGANGWPCIYKLFLNSCGQSYAILSLETEGTGTVGLPTTYTTTVAAGEAWSGDWTLVITGDRGAVLTWSRDDGSGGTIVGTWRGSVPRPEFAVKVQSTISKTGPWEHCLTLTPVVGNCRSCADVATTPSNPSHQAVTVPFGVTLSIGGTGGGMPTPTTAVAEINGRWYRFYSQFNVSITWGCYRAYGLGTGTAGSDRITYSFSFQPVECISPLVVTRTYLPCVSTFTGEFGGLSYHVQSVNGHSRTTASSAPASALTEAAAASITPAPLPNTHPVPADLLHPFWKGVSPTITITSVNAHAMGTLPECSAWPVNTASGSYEVPYSTSPVTASATVCTAQVTVQGITDANYLATTTTCSPGAGSKYKNSQWFQTASCQWEWRETYYGAGSNSTYKTVASYEKSGGSPILVTQIPCEEVLNRTTLRYGTGGTPPIWDPSGTFTSTCNPQGTEACGTIYNGGFPCVPPDTTVPEVDWSRSDIANAGATVTRVLSW